MTTETAKRESGGLSVVIPAFNEAQGIRDTIEEVLGTLSLMELAGYEVIVVDDGSSDTTAKQLEGLERVRTVRHPHNIGYGRALKTGIAAASFATVVITDADLSYPFSAVTELLAEYRKGFDMVVGARIGQNYGSFANKGPLRRVLKFMVEYVSGRDIPDVNSGLRVFNRDTAIRYFPRFCDTFSFTTSMTLAYMMTGRFVSYHPIQYRVRKGKTKVHLLRDSLRTLQYILEASVYYNPLKIFLLMSCLALGISALSFLGSVELHLLGGYVLGIAGLILSFLMFASGLLAVLLKQIMDKAG